MRDRKDSNRYIISGRMVWFYEASKMCRWWFRYRNSKLGARLLDVTRGVSTAQSGLLQRYGNVCFPCVDVGPGG